MPRAIGLTDPCELGAQMPQRPSPASSQRPTLLSYCFPRRVISPLIASTVCRQKQSHPHLSVSKNASLQVHRQSAHASPLSIIQAPVRARDRPTGWQRASRLSSHCPSYAPPYSPLFHPHHPTTLPQLITETY